MLLPQKQSESKDPQSIYANVDPPTEEGEGEEDKTGSYESVKNYMANIDQDDTNEGGVYYNVPDTGARNIEELEEDDDMYVYMKSGHNIDHDVPLPATAEDRKRHQSEPLSNIKKYVNISNKQKSRSQQPQSVGSKVAMALTTSGTGREGRLEPGKENGTETTEPECDASEQQPIYANCEEEEELYTEVA